MDRVRTARKLIRLAKTLQGATTHALASGVIKALLKKKFPRTKFGVRSKSYAGGSSVKIVWIDGPTEAEVDDLVSKYQYGSFDGMRDLYEYTNVDGGLPQVKYVLRNRKMSDRVEREIKEEISKKFRVDMDDEKEVWDKFRAWPNMVIYREFSERSF